MGVIGKLLRALLLVPALMLGGCIYLETIPPITTADLNTELDLSGQYLMVSASIDNGEFEFTSSEDRMTVTATQPGVYRMEGPDSSGTLYALRTPNDDPNVEALILFVGDKPDEKPGFMYVRATASDRFEGTAFGWHWLWGVGPFEELPGQQEVAARHGLTAETIDGPGYGMLIKNASSMSQLLEVYADPAVQAGIEKRLAVVMIPARGANAWNAETETVIRTALDPDVVNPHLAQGKVALVIGNDAYAEMTPLVKAVADARAFRDLLAGKGYEVVYRENATRQDMDLAIAEFLEKVDPGDTATFFYAGHGWSDGEQNYLVGVDAPSIASASVQERISIPVQNGANGIVDGLNKSEAALSVVILDACRNNPFASPGRGIGSGLAVQEPPRGTFVIYSAGAGQIALDRLSETDPDPNSVFTRTIIPLLAEDRPLIEVVKRVQEDVYDLAQTIGHDQEPAYYDQVRGSPCLTGTCGN